MQIAVIVPVYNEAALIPSKLEYFKQLAANTQLLFIDGNSSDNTRSLLKGHNFEVVNTTAASRGAQLAQGTNHTNCDVLLFHHFDTVLPAKALSLITNGLKTNHWGRFDVKIDDSAWMFRIIESTMNWRSCLSGISTGDQAIFVKRHVFLQYADKIDELPIMEDIYLSKQLKRASRPACIHTPIHVSSRYWRKNGILKSVFSMWLFRFLYFIGVSPTRLYHLYYS